MTKKFRKVGVGGTFDELHNGHKALLMKAFEVSENVMIGVSSDKFVNKMHKPHYTATFEKRAEELRRFLGKEGFTSRAEIIPIDDPYGGVLLSRNIIEALVVSKETQPAALKINEKRKEVGIDPLEMIVIEMVPSESDGAISTTSIRKGKIDREGHLLEKKTK